GGRAAQRNPAGTQRRDRARPLRSTAPAMNVAAHEFEAETADGHRYRLMARIPASPRRSLSWLPALGIAAKHYIPFAEALAARGVAVFLHEWRGGGSSALRPSRDHDWGYRELLLQDIPCSE